MICGGQKDIGLLVEGCDGYDDSLSVDGLQEALRKHSDALTASVLREDESVPSQTHGTRLKPVTVNPDRLVTPFGRTLLRESKTRN